MARKNPYEAVVKSIMDEVEELALVKAPLEDYLQALKDAREEINGWLDTSIDAAEQDIKRKRGE